MWIWSWCSCVSNCCFNIYLYQHKHIIVFLLIIQHICNKKCKNMPLFVHYFVFEMSSVFWGWRCWLWSLLSIFENSFNNRSSDQYTVSKRFQQRILHANEPHIIHQNDQFSRSDCCVHPTEAWQMWKWYHLPNQAIKLSTVLSRDVCVSLYKKWGVAISYVIWGWWGHYEYCRTTIRNHSRFKEKIKVLERNVDWYFVVNRWWIRWLGFAWALYTVSL